MNRYFRWIDWDDENSVRQMKRTDFAANDSKIGPPWLDIPPIGEGSDDDYPLSDTLDASRKIKPINDISRTFNEDLRK